MLEAGVKAPEFKLQDKDGNLVSLSDFKNKKIVRSNKCKKKLFVKMTGNISISFPSKSLVKFNGNQKILK